MYILKYYVKSKYFTFKRVIYKEFEDYLTLCDFVLDNLPFGSYEIFELMKEISYNDNKE